MDEFKLNADKNRNQNQNNENGGPFFQNKTSFWATKIVCIIAISLFLNACTTGQVEDGADGASADASMESGSAESDNSSTEASSGSQSLEDELSQSESQNESGLAKNESSNNQSQSQNFSNEDDLSLDNEKKSSQAQNQISESTQPESIPSPIVAEEKPIASRLVNLKNIKFKAHDSGGTIVIDGDGPINFTTRKNEANNQFIIEVSNSFLPGKLKRPLLTKDFATVFGAIESYQNPGSSTSRIVIQLKPGVSDPVVQAEGNSLLVVGSTQMTASSSSVENIGAANSEASGSVESSAAGSGSSSSANGLEPQYSEDETKILASRSLEEFLSSNTRFYGKKITLEVNEMDVKEVIKLLSDESGVNLVISDDVKGTVSLKLKDVPWDQILVLIMKTKKLGYVRNGNVLRIAPIMEIKTEENDAAQFAENMKKQMPLKVRMLPINYASVSDLETKAKAFLSDRGRIIADARTSSVVISDIEENLNRVIKYIQSIDVAPPQVMIEGKVVEASDTFARDFGVRWSATGKNIESGTASDGSQITQRGSLNIGTGVTATTFGLNYSIGSLDVFGRVDAQLGLFEREGLVKVLSSPRILAIHNESAEITQSTEVPVFSATSNIANGTETKTTSVTYKPVNLKLKVTPLVANTGTIQLNVDVNREFIAEKGELSKTPYVSVGKRSAQTKVLVRNGQTAVIGGIYQTDTTQGESKVPWLSDIPIVGWLFKNRSTNSVKTELMIFLTPRILGQADSQGMSSGGDL